MKAVLYEKDLLSGLILSRTLARNADMADVRIDGFEHFPDDELGTYDLVATNVPFGDIAVFDPEYTNSKSAVRRAAAKKIHCYYVLKGLDCLRDGGLLAYIITSNYLNMDSEQLNEALKMSRLIGAYRLANNLFKESGTEVGTDLLVLQKDEQKQGLTADESLLLTTYEDGGCPTNMYFDCYPDHVIATEKERDTDAYGKPGFVYTHKDGVSGIAADMGKVLSDDLKKNLESPSTDPSPKRKGSDKKREKKAKSEAKQENAEWMRKEQQMADVFDCYRRLYDYEAKEMAEGTELRKKLNALYDAYRLEWGPLNQEPNKAMAKRINKELLALEVREGDGWKKADIFERPVAFSTDDLHSVTDSHEALAQSLNDYGKPDVRYMAALTGKSEEEVCDELEGEIFFDPISEEWQIKSRFISGNVIEKIEAIKRKYPEAAMVSQQTEQEGITTTNPTERQVRKALAALQAAVPEPIPFDDLDFNLGERWVDTKIYSDFASEFFSMPGNEYGCKVEVTVKYDKNLDQYACDNDRGNEKIYTQYAVSSEASQTLDGMGLLVHALQNSCPKMMKYRRDERGRKIKIGNGNSYAKDEDPEAFEAKVANFESEVYGYAAELRESGNEAGTPNASILKERGVPDIDPVEYYNNWMLNSGYQANPRLMMKFCQNSGEAMDEYLSVLSEEDLSNMTTAFYPPTEKQMSQIGPFKFWPCTCSFYSQACNQTYIHKKNREKAIEDGAQFFFSTEAQQLEDGAVVGLIATNGEGEYVKFNARAVVLATGGFGGNRQMQKDLLPDLGGCLTPDEEFSVLMDSDGRGIQMGYWVGAKLDSLGIPTMNGKHYHPGFPQGVWLDSKGKRYCNEYWGPIEFRGRPALQMNRDGFYAFYDSKLPEYLEYTVPSHGSTYASEENLQSVRENLEQVLAAGAETLDELLDMVCSDDEVKANIKASIERYNELCEQQRDEDFGREGTLMFPVKEGPFFCDVKPSEIGWMMCTCGGLVINGDAQVLDDYYHPIPGLFAAGNCASGRFGTEYFTPTPGVSLGTAIVLGRECGKSVEQFLNGEL